jgi:bifunctional UDP-N-acetylglucosamine pyrophosphorylase / glucosamine-1-phosphate N-acetyltransferase
VTDPSYGTRAASSPAIPRRPFAVVVLAAGEGTRMKSARPKVLHGFAGRSLLGHVLAACAPLNAERTIVVVGHGRADVQAHLEKTGWPVTTVVQEPQRGTGHAVRIAMEALPAEEGGTIVVVPGDTPLLQPTSLLALLTEHHRSGAAATMLTSFLDDPTGYGRVIRDGDHVTRIVEQKDATDAELPIREFAAGMYAFDQAALGNALSRLSTDNAQGEEYLTDVVGILVGDGRRVAAAAAATTDTLGVNDRVQLAAAHLIYNRRLLDAHMRAGVTVVDPATTWIDADVHLAPDVTLHPSVYLHGATAVHDGATIGPDVTLIDTSVGEGTQVSRAVCNSATIGADCEVGPFAYLRPGARLAAGVKVGTYVEVKASDIGTGSKVPHLSYVGDATIGDHTNIGAATVFVNYDGVGKHHSTIGSYVRTGADNMFVAPVSVGDGAYTAAGSVIDQDVPPGALGIARARQRNVAGWVAKRRSGTAADDAARRAAQAVETTDHINSADSTKTADSADIED